MYHYLRDIEAREEGGTPAIVESIRAGLTFQIKQAVGPHFIEEREQKLARYTKKKSTSTNLFIFCGAFKLVRAM